MQQQKTSIYDDCVIAVLEILDEASVERSSERRATLLDLARGKASEFVENKPDSSEANYVAGLANYQAFCDDERHGPSAQAYLSEALRLDPNHQFARMFLGHYYYDTERYAEALDCFRRTDEDYFRSIPQYWRVLKLHELILCCRILLGSSEVTEQDFENLSVEYVSAIPWDALPPWELISALEKSVASPMWTFLDASRIKRLIIDMVGKLDVSDRFREDASNALSQLK